MNAGPILPDWYLAEIVAELDRSRKWREEAYASGMIPRPKPPTPGEIIARQIRDAQTEYALSLAPWLRDELRRAEEW